MKTPSEIDNEVVQGEQRVSALVGDRLCASCFYNLTGQPVLREPHYNMLIVRCPECGSVASVQEYPLLGRWSRRWAMLIAASWLLCLVILAAISAGIVAGLASEVSTASSYSMATFIADRNLEWQTQQATQQTGANPMAAFVQQFGGYPGGQSSPYSNIDETWWSQQDPKALLAAAGGWFHAADWAALYLWVWYVLPLLLMGAVWSVASVNRRGWRQYPIIVIIGAVAGVFLLIGHFSQSAWFPWRGWLTAIEIAEPLIGLPFLLATFAYSLMVLALGLLVGRKIARMIVRALLPLRLISSLSFLWIADDLAPPSISDRHHTRASHKAGQP